MVQSDAGALLLAATSTSVRLLAVNVNYPSSYSALAASAILAHYGRPQTPIGIKRPLTDAAFFDSWSFTLGEYASKIAYRWSGGTLPWGCADDAWDPVSLYRKALSEAPDQSVTIASIGFFENVRAHPTFLFPPHPAYQSLAVWSLEFFCGWVLWAKWPGTDSRQGLQASDHGRHVSVRLRIQFLGR